VAIVLKKEVVVNSWDMIVMDGGTKVDQVFKDTEEYIKASKAPGLRFQRVKVSASLVGDVLGKTRDFLWIKNDNLSKYEMYVGVREYGVNLDVTWYLIYEPGPFMRLFMFAINKAMEIFKKNWKLSFPMTLFEERDLTVFTTIMHHCVLDAVEKVTKGTGQEINKSSKGFLGIS
jgi:hypothetical protein